MPPFERLGCGQKAEHHEQADLGQPGHAFHERARGPTVGQVGIAEDERGDVHRGEPAGVDRSR